MTSLPTILTLWIHVVFSSSSECFNDQSANEMRKKPENFKFEIGFTMVIKL